MEVEESRVLERTILSTVTCGSGPTVIESVWVDRSNFSYFTGRSVPERCGDVVTVQTNRFLRGDRDHIPRRRLGLRPRGCLSPEGGLRGGLIVRSGPGVLGREEGPGSVSGERFAETGRQVRCRMGVRTKSPSSSPTCRLRVPPTTVKFGDRSTTGTPGFTVQVSLALWGIGRHVSGMGTRGFSCRSLFRPSFVT